MIVAVSSAAAFVLPVAPSRAFVQRLRVSQSLGRAQSQRQREENNVCQSDRRLDRENFHAGWILD